MEKFQKNDRFWGVKMNEKVSNLVFFKEDYYWGRNPYYHNRVALFMMDGLYFMYSYTSSYNGVGASFGEISEEVYRNWCTDLREKYPWNEGRYDDGKSSFVLIDETEGTFEEEVFPEECYGITHKRLLAVLEEIKAVKEAEARQQAEADAARRKDYARNCGRVAKRLGISFVNVLRLGYQNEEQLKEFQKSMAEAKKQLTAMSEEDRDSFEHEIFCCGRARMAGALAELGVQTFGKDVYYMDFSELSAK